MSQLNCIIKKSNVCILIFVIILFSVLNMNVKADEYMKDMKTNKKHYMNTPRGLEVDSKGNIYISTIAGINVYNNSGEFIHGLQVDTSGTYEMMFEDNGNLNIAIARGDFTYIYNEDGILLGKNEEMGYDTFVYYHKNNKVKFDSIGNEYKLTNLFGYTKVTKTMIDGTESTVYRIPFFQWMGKLLFYLFCVLFFITVPYIILRYHGVIKKKSKKRRIRE